jgi:hypothetical protein
MQLAEEVIDNLAVERRHRSGRHDDGRAGPAFMGSARQSRPLQVSYDRMAEGLP